MSIEGPVSVSEKEVKIVLSKENLVEKLKEALSKNYDDDNKEYFVSIIQSSIRSINDVMDSILDTGISDFSGNIDIDSNQDEIKILKLISTKLNKVISNFLDNADIYNEQLSNNLLNIEKQVMLSKEEQGYYNDFIKILKGSSFSSIGQNTRDAINNHNDALRLASL